MRKSCNIEIATAPGRGEKGEKMEVLILNKCTSELHPTFFGKGFDWRKIFLSDNAYTYIVR